jgi:hypothetical protein
MIMKSLKGHMMEVAKSEHGHLILLALFDTVDDTVLLKKVYMGFSKFPHGHILVSAVVSLWKEGIQIIQNTFSKNPNIGVP